MKYSVIVPTLNAGDDWTVILSSLREQSQKPTSIIVIDSGSQDNTINISKANYCEILTIKSEEFNHGATRQYATSFLGKKIDIVIFVTQDALVYTKSAFENILKVFVDSRIGAVYGKQLPRKTATLLERLEREFNYNNNSKTYSLEDRLNYGMKICFLSNAFTAYRLDALMGIGGFPDNVIVSEDMYVGAKMLKAGWKLAYCAEASVIHSHSYDLRELFGRYFDIGVFNAREFWIRKEFGVAEREGLGYVKSELGFLLRKAPWLIPYSLIRTTIKYIGFRLGLLERYLPVGLKKSISRQKNYWI